MSAPVSHVPHKRVLPTLNADGTRNNIRPRLYAGRLYRVRRWVALALLVSFAAVPFVRIQGKPAILLNVVEREFTLFGRTFLPTDGALLMLLMLSIFVAVFWTTALFGRAWCGYGCPQTVYMEFVFRPIERLFEGPREQQLRIDRHGWTHPRRLLKNAVFLLVSALVGNLFLAYFVGVETQARWVTHSPAQHPTGFLVMLVTTLLVFFDFAYFREQMCTVVCPYARLQSALLDRRSLVIAYDQPRGEPRSKGKPKPGHGDCIDCNACVTTCPTGIDIRQGLQLECIACGQCADACDSIMTRINKPKALIGYNSQARLAGEKARTLLRPRVVIYSVLLVGLIGALSFGLSRSQDAELTLLRGLGAPFSVDGDNVTNHLRLKVENRTNASRVYRVELADVPGARLIAPELPLRVEASAHRTTGFFAVIPRSAIPRGERLVHLRVSDDANYREELPYKLLGPESLKP